MKHILGGLGQIAAGMAELRNLYGTGHGRGQRIKGLKTRHAEFAARAAIAYTAFVLDTVNDPTAPWRSGGGRTSSTPAPIINT
jgi:Abortive infection C-terminus